MILRNAALQSEKIFFPTLWRILSPHLPHRKVWLQADVFARPCTLFSRKSLQINGILVCEDIRGDKRKFSFQENWLPPRGSRALKIKRMDSFSTAFPTLFPTHEIRICVPIRRALFSNLAVTSGEAIGGPAHPVWLTSLLPMFHYCGIFGPLYLRILSHSSFATEPMGSSPPSGLAGLTIRIGRTYNPD